MAKGRTNTTRATRGKLERALIELESFANADNVDHVISARDQNGLARAIDLIQIIESTLYHRATR